MRRGSVTGLAEVTSTPTGLHGLIQNKKCLGLATFASLGGVLYGYNQVCSEKSHVKFALLLTLISCRVFSVKCKSWLTSSIDLPQQLVAIPIKMTGTNVANINASLITQRRKVFLPAFWVRSGIDQGSL